MERSWEIRTTDVLDGLRAMPARSVQAAVTSPPYWQLRKYDGVSPTRWADGAECCLGLEPTPEAFIAHLVEVFDELRRVLRDDGTLFVNLGDSYNAGTETERKPSNGNRGNDVDRWQNPGEGNRRTNARGLKPGDRCGIPERFALAMQAAGWWWRDTIIWHKRSPMPSSQNGWRWERCKVKVAPGSAVNNGGIRGQKVLEHGGWTSAMHPATKREAEWSDCPGCPKCSPNGGLVLRYGRFRTTTAHEPVFMFAKSERYFCDAQACREKTTGGTHPRGSKLSPPKEAANVADGNGHAEWNRYTPDLVADRLPRSVWSLKDHRALIDWLAENAPDVLSDFFDAARAPESLISLSAEPSKELHFAAFPSELPRKILTMATSAGGCCSACGRSFAPIVKSERVATRPAINNKIWKHQAAGDGNGQRSDGAPSLDPERHIAVTTTLGYRSTCGCGADSVPSIILDPFAGTGTTIIVARRLGLRAIGLEASDTYADMARRRVVNDMPLLNTG